ncbi:hypothetical protein PR048_018868 [Dryococelus australis]|uniref:Uncharacterized protein n=1 Tax=Dryococelus australis TaxID=614101 RepID=A0ABQ9H1Z1_9NEOP|nr:hypothetical protein PR048_018868 [Dryococelus australis]
MTKKKTKEAFRFAVPMTWMERRNHCNDCYFFSADVTSYNSKNKKVIRCPNLPSAIRPVGHGPDPPAPKPPEVSDDILNTSSYAQSDADGEADDEFECTDNLELSCLLNRSK